MRTEEFIKSIPFITCLLLFINISIHIYIFIFSDSLGKYSIIPYRVIYLQEFYRLISSAFTHNGILHILMNMMSLFQLGSSLENQMGSYQFLVVTLWTIPLTSSLYIFFYWIAAVFIFQNNSYLNQSAVGYSGVLFAYALLESYLSPPHTRSVYGLFNVSSRIYPWILLVAIQVILPNISFVGHLSGLLIGVLFVNGFLNILLPSIDFYHISERNSCCSQFTNISNYINSTNKIMPFSSTTNSSSFSLMLSSLISSIQWILLQIWNIFSLFCHIIGIPLDHYILNCLTYILNLFTQSNNIYQRVSNNDIENINENKQNEQTLSIEL